MYSNSISLPKVCMVENCLLNNNNVLCCSDSSSAKFDMKRKRANDIGDMREIREIFISLDVFLRCFLPSPQRSVQFTYNNAKTSHSQLFAYLVSHFYFRSSPKSFILVLFTEFFSVCQTMFQGWKSFNDPRERPERKAISLNDSEVKEEFLFSIRLAEAVSRFMFKQSNV